MAIRYILLFGMFGMFGMFGISNPIIFYFYSDNGSTAKWISLTPWTPWTPWTEEIK